MKIPKQFSIKGKLWKVRHRKTLPGTEMETQGLCVYDKRTILLLRGLSEKEIPTVLYHEMVHACLHEAHLNPNSGLTPSLEEIICDSVADLMATMFDLKEKE